MVQDRIRALHRELMKQACGVVPMARMCEFLVTGLASRNSKTRVECIEVRTQACSIKLCCGHQVAGLMRVECIEVRTLACSTKACCGRLSAGLMRAHATLWVLQMLPRSESMHFNRRLPWHAGAGGDNGAGGCHDFQRRAVQAIASHRSGTLEMLML